MADRSELRPGVKVLITNKGGTYDWNRHMHELVGKVFTLYGETRDTTTWFVCEDTQHRHKYDKSQRDHWYWMPDNFIVIPEECIYANSTYKFEE